LKGGSHSKKTRGLKNANYEQARAGQLQTVFSSSTAAAEAVLPGISLRVQ